MLFLLDLLNPPPFSLNQFRAVITMSHREKFEDFCESFLNLYDSITVSRDNRRLRVREEKDK